MTHIENVIINLARTHGGIVTVGDMVKAGFTKYALSQWAYHHGPYTRISKGAYAFDSINDEYQIPVSDMNWFVDMYEAGEGSYFVGSTVLDFYNLGLQEPISSYMRSPSHAEGEFGTINIQAPRPNDRIDILRGIRLQNLYQAFQETRGVREDYLLDAAEQAWDRNLLNAEEYNHTITNIRKRRIMEARP